MTAALTVGQALAQSGLVPLDGQVLLAHVVGRNRAWLAAHRDDTLPRAQADAFAALARRRRGGEPVAHLTGVREFWGLELAVTPDVLIPRPETEALVELALAAIPPDRAMHILDLGTGSGAVALALAHERPEAHVLAVDRAPAALAVARANAQRLALHNVTFATADWYAGIGEARFDAIVSNPPYVAAGDPHLDEGDVRFEPAGALTPGGDGLAALRTIVSGAPAHLCDGGVLLVEHGYDQREAVARLFAAAGFGAPLAARDLAGHWRVAGGRTGRVHTTSPGAPVAHAAGSDRA